MPSDEQSLVRFANLSKRTVQFYWLNTEGVRHPIFDVPYLRFPEIPFIDRASFVAIYEDSGECIGVYVLDSVNNQIVIIDETTPQAMIDWFNEIQPKDSDGDGVADEDDLCPDFRGRPEVQGC